MKNKKGLIICFTKYQKTIAYKHFCDNFKKYNIELDILEMDEYALAIGNDKPSLDVSKYDFLIQLVKDQYISSLFEKAGKPCFNKYLSMCNSDDKFLTFVKLAESGIPHPKTISGTTDYDGLKLDDFKRSEHFADKIENNIGFPLIAKPTFGYGSRGIEKINDRNELNIFLDKIGQENYLYQEFIPDNSGNCIRFLVVGKQVIFGFKRISTIDFNKSYEETEAIYNGTDEQRKIAEKIATIFDLDYCAVDFFEMKDGSPMICEVNANPGGIEDNQKLTGIDQTEKFVELIVNKCFNH